MTALTNLLAFLGLVVTLLIVWRQGWPGRLALFVGQSLLLALLAVVIGILAGKPGLLVVAGVVVLLKAWLIPRALARMGAGTPVLPPLAPGTVLLFLGLGTLGMGNGAVFQIVPQRFPKEIGVITGIVGAAGGVGGFLLPNLLGTLRQVTGSFAPGFVIFGLVGLASAAALVRVGRAWQRAFVSPGGVAVPAPTP